MVQSDLDEEYWAGKRIQEARESSMKNSVGLLDIAERLGLLKNRYKNLEEFLTEYNGVSNQLYDNILKDVKLKKKQQPTLEQQRQEENKEDGSATDKQRKACWAIIHGRDGRPELEEELTTEIDKLSFEEASDFIDKYGKKR